MVAVTVLQVRVTNFVLEITAVVVTLFRLVERTRTHKLWWDDAWAALSACCAIIFMVAVEILFRPTRSLHSSRIVAYYMAAEGLYAVLWTARLCILCTVLRITVSSRLRQALVLCGFLFAIAWAVLFAQIFWTCEGADSEWKIGISPMCNLGREVAIAEIVCDVVADAVLIAVPIRMIWGARLARAQKIRLLSVFAASLCTTGTSLAHAYYLMHDDNVFRAFTVLIQASVSLIVANLYVVVASFLRISKEDGGWCGMLGACACISHQPSTADVFDKGIREVMRCDHGHGDKGRPGEVFEVGRGVEYGLESRLSEDEESREYPHDHV